MGKVQGYNKYNKATTLSIFRNERERLELTWDGEDILLYLDGKFLKKLGAGDLTEDVLEALLDNVVKYDDLTDSFSVDPTTKAVDLNVQYITISDYTGGDLEPLPPIGDLVVTPTSLSITRGDDASIIVVLNKQPVADVVLSVVSNDLAVFTVDKSSITFTDSDWDVPQVFSISAIANVNPSDISNTIDVSLLSTADPSFINLETITVNATSIVGGTVGFYLTKSSINMFSGETDSFDIVLTAQPTNDVIFNIESANSNYVSVTNPSVIFSSIDWETPKTVNLAATTNNSNIDLNTIITTEISSTLDPNYAVLGPQYLAATVKKAELAPYEVLVGDTIWKAENESWTDGGAGISVFGGNNPVTNTDFDYNLSEYGRMYDDDALDRLLTANTGYRLPSDSEMYALFTLLGNTPGESLGYVDSVLKTNTLWRDGNLVPFTPLWTELHGLNLTPGGKNEANVLNDLTYRFNGVNFNYYYNIISNNTFVRSNFTGISAEDKSYYEDINNSPFIQGFLLNGAITEKNPLTQYSVRLVRDV